jgi:hypothetical protein
VAIIRLVIMQVTPKILLNINTEQIEKIDAKIENTIGRVKYRYDAKISNKKVFKQLNGRRIAESNSRYLYLWSISNE